MENLTLGQAVAYILLALFGTGGAIAGIRAVFLSTIQKYADARISQATKAFEAQLELEREKSQAQLEEAKQRLIAELDAQRERRQAEADEREHKQRQQDLALGYQQAEAAVAQQRLAELLANYQEFFQGQLTKSLDELKETTDNTDRRTEHLARELGQFLEELTQTLARYEKTQENLRDNFRLLVGIVEKVNENWKRHRYQDSQEDA